jgi:hypothetical protein
MDIKAETNKKLFEKLAKTSKPKNEVPDHVTNLLNTLRNSSNSTSSTASTQVLVNEIPKVVASMNISKVPTAQEPVLPKVSPPVVVASEKAEIQQWLDDILDD